MFNKHDGGKGDRPILPKDAEKFNNNWDLIFKKKKKDEDCKGIETEESCKSK